MIRKILPEEVYAGRVCRPVDITRANGLFHSVLNPASGMIRDLLETAKFNEHSVLVLTANQIGYLGLVMVMKVGKSFGVMLNPTIEGNSRNTITVKFCDHLGFNRSMKFRHDDVRLVQEGLKRLGVM